MLRNGLFVGHSGALPGRSFVARGARRAGAESRSLLLPQEVSGAGNSAGNVARDPEEIDPGQVAKPPDLRGTTAGHPLPGNLHEPPKPDGTERPLGIPTVLDRVIQQAVARNTFVLGLQEFTRANLEAVRDRGERLRIHVLGLARIAHDVSPKLALATIESVRVLGGFQAPPAVRDALSDRIQ